MCPSCQILPYFYLKVIEAALNSSLVYLHRYYIKNVHSSEPLLPDDQTADLMKESQVCLLQLNPVELSTQLMVDDFTIFRQIEATEYVDDLFEVRPICRVLYY